MEISQWQHNFRLTQFCFLNLLNSPLTVFLNFVFFPNSQSVAERFPAVVDMAPLCSALTTNPCCLADGDREFR